MISSNTTTAPLMKMEFKRFAFCLQLDGTGKARKRERKIHCYITFSVGWTGVLIGLQQGLSLMARLVGMAWRGKS